MLNPFSWNDAGNRTVVERTTGEQIVQFAPVIFYAGFFAKENTHRTPQSLVVKQLAPYSKECRQSSAQLMSSEKHHGMGRAQMAQDFMDQLKEGAYLLRTA